MKTMWKGAISFGLVTIPVRAYGAVEEKSFKFNQLHEKDQGRIKYKRVCAVCEQEVPFDEIVRGYEYEKGHYVVLTEDELDRGVPSSRTIDILKFVPAEEIDPILFKSSYYITPEGPGLKAYRLLEQALIDDRRVAIARVAFRDKEHLSTLRVKDGVFVLETMYWPDEIREAAFDELKGDVDVRPQELQMAKSLIDNMTGPFEADEFRDTYREKLEAAVGQKIEGREIVAVSEEPETGKVVDLMEALRASVEAASKGAGGAEAAPAKKPRAKKAASG